jgi:drug/metabolite transporter (DMT)-like permease
MVATSVVVFAPFAVITWDIEAAAVPFIVASGALQLAYFLLLAVGYERARLSVIYPIARGAAPVIVLGIGVLALAVSPSAGEGIGVGLVAIGVLLVRGRIRSGDGTGLAVALAVAACIAGYTLVDKEGLRYADPVAYLELVLIGPAVAQILLVRRYRGQGALRAQLRAHVIAAGVAGFGAYVLVLAALERASAASVAAVRESSVLIATALAAVALRERVSARTGAGAGVIVAGVALISLG